MADTSNERWPEYHPAAITALKALIVLFELVCLWGQYAVVVLSGDIVATYPELAPARWPYAIAGILGILCFEAALIPLWRLLTLARRRDVFSGRAVTWTDAIIVCAAAEGVLVLFVLLYGSLAHAEYYDPAQGVAVDVAMGAAAMSAACVVALLLIAAFILLLLVMRSLLKAAIAQRDELAEVI
ncbi:DUF2975 domain-containing protein [Bifidobacterium sp. CP2]|uniref:DUF2975 domain-containing protein n=1 Tax=Bifidobacterium TaxID=1678 RepID=UPI001BDC4CB7|nr:MULTISPECIES: DUF2975 domain-containing protein [Bifidobacterium]MBT1182200.1 DUF2975 domain-containing protein [Bifidobacterium sp. CP2]MBW3080530.1 DUF2975 domain-containing protein [Bifidobacterium saguinibicoloris]